MNVNRELKDILCCPTCRKKLVYKKDSIRCPNCKKEALVEGRLVDFSQMTPKLPLDLGKHIQELTENAGQLMNDIGLDWRVKSVLKEIKKKAHGMICLEIGGADGPMTPTIESLFDIVLTFDYSKTFLKRIEVKTKKTVCLFGDAHFMPLQDHTIDMIVCSEVLEHATIPTQLLTEIQRVIKKSGTVILSVPNESILSIRRKIKITHTQADDTHVNFFTPETLKKMLYRTGLALVDIQTILPPNHSIKAILRNIINLVQKGFYGTFILCTIRSMENPWIYWESFYKKIRK